MYAAAFSSNSPLLLQKNGTTHIYVDDTTGNVGIGTISPKSTFHSVGSFATITTTVNYNTTLDSTHNVVLCDGGTNFTITLPNAAGAVSTLLV